MMQPFPAAGNISSESKLSMDEDYSDNGWFLPPVLVQDKSRCCALINVRYTMI